MQDGIDALPGMGPKLRARLEGALGGTQALVHALDEGDVVGLSKVHGLSRTRAVRLVQAHRGDDVAWLLTDHAEDLARDALQPFLDRAVTTMGRAALETLAPTRDAKALEQRLDEARRALDRLADVDLDEVCTHLRHVAHPAQPRPRPVRELTILVDEGPLLDGIREHGLDRWVDLATHGDDIVSDGLVLGATLQDLPRGAIHITPRSPHQAVPYASVAWAKANQALLEALSALAPVLGVDDAARPILDALEHEGPRDPVDLRQVAEACVADANKAIEAALEKVTLSGKDLLEVMHGGSSAKVESLVAEAHNTARRRFEKEAEVPSAPFTDTFPLRVDPRGLERLERQLATDEALTRHKAAVVVADVVHQHRGTIDAMVKAAIELDRWQAVARASRELGLAVPTIGDGFEVRGALHLALDGEGDRVDYPVPNGVALLTGANSGGKTTLLETLGQVAVLAHLGLPVPAQAATVPLLEGLAYYARPRQLGAGAFEGFLRTIEPVLLADERVLVLADELEAMTELEAAAAILAEVVTRLEARGAPSVLITHLAPFILAHVEVRVDGIEAKGLDEDNELVVDRTPKVGRLARSTPELILQRLRNEANGARKDLYAAMLARLQRE